MRAAEMTGAPQTLWTSRAHPSNGSSVRGVEPYFSKASSHTCRETTDSFDRARRRATLEEAAVAPLPPVRLHMTRPERFCKKWLYRLVYGTLALKKAFEICCGCSKALIPYRVEASPPPAFINFRIREDALDALRNELRLPNGLRLCPVRCTEGDESTYLLTLIVYRVTGITSGFCAEWVTYVHDRDGRPCYLVLEAGASGGTMEPIHGLTRRMAIRYGPDEGGLRISIGRGREQFEIRFSPDARRGPDRRPDVSWVGANDRVYWRNGVYDEVRCDSAMAAGPLADIEPEQVTIRNGTKWSQFVDPRPEQVLLYGRRLTYAIVPWRNHDTAPLASGRKRNGQADTRFSP